MPISVCFLCALYQHVQLRLGFCHKILKTRRVPWPKSLGWNSVQFCPVLVQFLDDHMFLEGLWFWSRLTSYEFSVPGGLASGDQWFSGKNNTTIGIRGVCRIVDNTLAHGAGDPSSCPKSPIRLASFTRQRRLLNEMYNVMDAVKFDSFNNLWSSVHTVLVNMLHSVRL